MDIHDIPGVTVLNMSKCTKDEYVLEIILITIISAILFCFILCLIPTVIDYIKYSCFSVTSIDVLFGIIIVILIILDTIFIYHISTNIDNLYNPLYEITLDETVSSDLYTYYTIIEQRGCILEVYPSDDNEADKYIIEHSNK